MNITVYKELSNAQEIIAIEAGKTIAQNFPTLDTENALILVNGKQQTADYVVQENDVIMVRFLPGMTGLAIVAGIVALVAVGVAIWGGIEAYKAKEAAEKSQKELEKLKGLSNKNDIDNRPFIRGATNSLATDKLNPYIMGRHLFTPYLLCNPYYELSGVDGKDEYINMVFVLGFNKQVIKSINIDDILIKTFTDTEPQQGAYTIDSGIFAEDGLIEISQDGSLFKRLTKCNYKVSSTTCNDEIPYQSEIDAGEKDYLTYTLADYAQDVTVAINFPYGLYEMQDDGTKIETTVRIYLEYSLDGGTTWNDPTMPTTIQVEKPKSEEQLREEYNAYHSKLRKELERSSDWKDLTLAQKSNLLKTLPTWNEYRLEHLNETVIVEEESYTGCVFKDGVQEYPSFKRNVASKELRYWATYKFTTEQIASAYNAGSPIMIRVRTTGNKDSKIKNNCYVLFYQSTICNPNETGRFYINFESGSSENNSALYEGSTGSAMIAALNGQTQGHLTLIDSSIKEEEKANWEYKTTSCLVMEGRERAYCTLMAVRLKATKNNENKVKKLNVVTQGIARVWDGSRWSTKKSETRNPAAWALEVETSDRHLLSRYSDTELDLESFGAFYQWCEANGFLFDHVITNKTKKDDILNYIMEATGACIYYDIYGRRAIAIDQKRENAIAVYNPQNIIKITNKKTFSRKTDALRIKYINSQDDLYKEDTILVLRKENGSVQDLTGDSVIKDVTVTGITTYSHIIKYARRLMAIETLRNKTTTIEVGNEGIFFTPYSKVLIQDDSLKIGLGHSTIKSVEWENGRLAKINLTGQVTFKEHYAHGVTIQCYGQNGFVPLNVRVKTQTGSTSELEPMTALYEDDSILPEAGNVLSFGILDSNSEFTRITTPYIISGIKRADNGFTLELANYNEAIFESGTIPVYMSNITQQPAESNGSVPADVVTKEDLMLQTAALYGKDGISVILEKNALVFKCDAEGVLEAQKIVDPLHVLQGTVHIPYKITGVVLPSGVTMTSEHPPIFEVAAGAKLPAQSLIELHFNAFGCTSFDPLMDEFGEVYYDEAGEPYGDYILDGTEYPFTQYISLAKAFTGKRGGMYNGTTRPSYFVKGDTYLDLNDMYLKEYDGEKWVSIPYNEGTKYNQAMADIIAEADSTDEVMKLANAWVANLVAGTALINQLFAKSITMQQGGIIKSGNFEAQIDSVTGEVIRDEKGLPLVLDADGEPIEWTQGWAVDNAGNAYFANGTFKGHIEASSGTFKGTIEATDGFFTGSIDSGPLKLNKNVAGSTVFTANSGEHLWDIYEALNRIGVFQGSFDVSGVDKNTLGIFNGDETSFLQISYDVKTEWKGGEYFEASVWKSVLASAVLGIPAGVGDKWRDKQTEKTVTFRTAKGTYTGRWYHKYSEIVEKNCVVNFLNLEDTVNRTWYEGDAKGETNITFGQKSMTFRLTDLPEGEYEGMLLGTVYHEDGNLKVKYK